MRDSALWAWARAKYRYGLIPYFAFAALAIFQLQLAVIFAVLWVGFRTEVLLAALRYGDTVNARRLNVIEERLGIAVDANAIHASSG